MFCGPCDKTLEVKHHTCGPCDISLEKPIRPRNIDYPETPAGTPGAYSIEIGEGGEIIITDLSEKTD